MRAEHHFPRPLRHHGDKDFLLSFPAFAGLTQWQIAWISRAGLRAESDPNFSGTNLFQEQIIEALRN
jgi:hypothetical protein